MKGKIKKLLSAALAVVMAFSGLAVSASAGWFDDWLDGPFEDFGSVTVNNIYYTLDDELMTAIVSTYETDDEGLPALEAEITIPETVTSDGKSYTVTDIGLSAFAQCVNLRKVTLPETITCIDDYAFVQSENLEEVIIPDTAELDYFGSGVFESTPVLGYLAENSENGEVIIGKNVLYAYLGSESTYTVPEEITIIADYCFFMSGVEEVILSESIDEIKEYTFASCRNLKEITVPDSVFYIGDGAFSDCSSLEKINLGDCLEMIGTKAFEGTKIKEIYLGEALFGVTGAFAGCNTLEKITCHENGMYYMDGNALIGRLEIADEDGSILVDEEFLEYYMITSDATSYTVPEDIWQISNYAFYNCKQLESVTLSAPSFVGSYAFAHCDFESFDFDKLYAVSEGAFKGCKKLTSANLSNADLISDSAFENCTALREVAFGDTLCYIGSRAFANTALSAVDIGGEYCAVFEGAFAECPELRKISFNSGTDYIDCYIAPRCPKLERVYISESVTYIDECAFNDNSNVVFEVIKYSDGYDFVKDMGNEHEIVGKVPFFTRVANFFTDIFYRIFGWLMFI